MQYICIKDTEESEPIEIPSQEDGTLLLASLTTLYPGATGLKYRVNDRVRAVRIVDGILHPPPEGWGDSIYSCIFPKVEMQKRKADDDEETNGNAKHSKKDKDDEWAHTDLVVLGLPWKTTDKELHEYFTQYGELQFAQVKTDPITRKSKGFGFIRFKDKDTQMRVMLQRHQIDGRWCDVRIPVSKETPASKKSPCKVFVGQCTADMTEEILRDYFAKFGEISDLYVPKPFRAFAFVTFVDANVARKVCSEEHMINDTKVYTTEAVPKDDRSGGGGNERRNQGGGSGGVGGRRRRSRSRERRGGRGGRFEGEYERRGGYDYGTGVGMGSGSVAPWDRGGDDYAGRQVVAGGYEEDLDAWRRPRYERSPTRYADPALDTNHLAAVVNKAVASAIGSMQRSPTQDNGAFKDDMWGIYRR